MVKVVDMATMKVTAEKNIPEKSWVYWRNSLECDYFRVFEMKVV